MLFSRYGQGETVLSMVFEDAIDLINFANRKRLEDMLTERWIINYEREMSFSDFKRELGIKEDSKEEKK